MESRRFPHNPTGGGTPQCRSPNFQTAMIEACESGIVLRFQPLLHLCNVKEGDSPIAPKYHEPDPPRSAPPATWEMIISAVIHEQSSILGLTLITYPAIKLDRHIALKAPLSNPQLETFKLLHAHSPTISDYAFDALNTSLLMEACTNGDPLLPK